MAEPTTNNIFQLYVCRLYDFLFQKLLVTDCPCYAVYKCTCPGPIPSHTCELNRFLFVERHNYFACVLLPGPQHQVAHRKFPILFGSALDLKIRAKHLAQGDVCLYGSILTQSGGKLVTNFLTNNLVNGYSYLEKAKSKTQVTQHVYRMNISDDRHTLQLKFLADGSFEAETVDDIEVAVRRKQQQFLNKRDFVQPVDSLAQVFEFIQRCVKFEPRYVDGVTQADYERYMRAMIQDPIPLDSLLNKTVLTGPVILKRMYESCVAAADTGAQSVASNMGTLFTSGNGYHVLTKKKHIKVSSEFSQSIYVPIDGEKFDQVASNLAVIKRYTNTQTQMSKALQFPVDARGFLCLLTIKEMANAGQTIYFASGCVSSPPVPVAYLFKVVDEILKDPKYQAEAAASLASGEAPRRLVVESFLLNLLVARSFVRWLKARCTFVFVREVNHEYLNVQHSGNILMKFSSRYQLYLATNETEFFPDAFAGAQPLENLSWFAYRLAPNFWQTMPAKLTVSIANIRGSLCVIPSELAGKLFLFNVGYNSALLHQIVEPDTQAIQVAVQFFNEAPLQVWTNVDKLMYLKLALLDEPCPVGRLQTIDWTLQPRGRLTGSAISNVWPESDTNRMLEFFDRHLGFAFEVTNRKSVGCPVGLVDSRYRGNVVLVENPKRLALDTRTPHTNQLYLWVAFGDRKGGTNEDGVVLDRTLCKHGPVHINAATFKVSFTGGPKNDVRVYHPVNKQVGSHLVFGVLVTKSKLAKNCSKNVSVHQVCIKDLYHYWIFVIDHVEGHKDLTSYYHDQVVSIHYRYLRPIGVGTKISWIHGQKNVVSLVDDLSHMKFWTRTGQCVHPQMLAPPAGILGRSPVGQFVDNVTSDMLAVNEFGMFVAPLAVNLHHIDPGVKMKMNSPKVCLMTQDNGFLGNDLSEVMGVLERQAANNVAPRFDLLCELAKTHHVKFEFMSTAWFETCERLAAQN